MNLIKKLTIKSTKNPKKYLSAKEIKQKVLIENKLPKAHGNKSLYFVDIYQSNR